MSEATMIQQNGTQVQNPAPTENTPEQPKQEDIVARVNKFSPEKKSQSTPTNLAEEGFNRNDIDKITDPVARKFAEDAYKSLQAGYSKKFETLASERKQIDSLKSELESQKSLPWSPDRVQSLLKDPSFVSAAQSIVSTQAAPQQGATLTEDEWSMLTPREQQMYQTQVQQSQVLNSLASEVSSFKTKAEDESLKSKYAGFDPSAVNKLQQDLLAGRYQATREDVFKVYDYENAIKRAYEMGLSDRKVTMQEKASALSTNGFSATPVNEVPAKGDKESSTNYFKRLAMNRLMQSQGKR